MVKSKSAGYLCQTLKPSKIQRFSLVEEHVEEDDDVNDEVSDEREEQLLKSLLPQTNVNTGKKLQGNKVY